MRERFAYLVRRAETVIRLAGPPLSRAHETLFHPLRRARRKVLEANDRATRRYVPKFYEGWVTLFRVKDRGKDFPHHGSLSMTDRSLGWTRLCGEGVDVHEVQGSHSSLMEEEVDIQALGKKLAQCLSAASESH